MGRIIGMGGEARGVKREGEGMGGKSIKVQFGGCGSWKKRWYEQNKMAGARVCR